MINILLKLISESLMSLYPTIIKKINIDINIQIWTRLLMYSFVAFIFADKANVLKLLASKNGIALSTVNILHILSTYIGFKYLDGGIAFSIFYIYPLFIILFGGHGFSISMIFIIIGLILLAKNNISTTYDKPFIGFIMVIIAAITEAIIYFIVKKLPSKNSWNILFVTYILGATVFSIYMGYLYINGNIISENMDSKVKKDTIYLLIINGAIGSLAYYLRFYTIKRLKLGLYAMLSYFSIIMAFVYGYLWSGETINIREIIGMLCIVIAGHKLMY